MRLHHKLFVWKVLYVSFLGFSEYTEGSSSLLLLFNALGEPSQRGKMKATTRATSWTNNDNDSTCLRNINMWYSKLLRCIINPRRMVLAIRSYLLFHSLFFYCYCCCFDYFTGIVSTISSSLLTSSTVSYTVPYCTILTIASTTLK